MNKQITISLFLTLICSFLQAQNWRILQPSYQYHYTMNDSVNYSYNTDYSSLVTIRLDSIRNIGLDTLHYLNRVIGRTFPRHPNQPQFLQRTIIQRGGIFNLRDTGNVVIDTRKEKGESWLLDSVQMITATVVSKDTATYLGVKDSVKTIRLSSGDTILLSKSIGILRYPFAYGSAYYYVLSGIGGLGIGEQIPTYPDFLILK